MNRNKIKSILNSNKSVLAFYPNRTNLAPANIRGKVDKAINNVIHKGFSVDHVENRYGQAYLKFRADKTSQKTKYDLRVYTYEIGTNRQIEITHNFWKEYGKLRFNSTPVYNSNFMS